MIYDTKIYCEIVELWSDLEPENYDVYQKQSTCPVNGLWDSGLLKILNDSKLSVNKQVSPLIILDQFGII